VLVAGWFGPPRSHAHARSSGVTGECDFGLARRPQASQANRHAAQVDGGRGYGSLVGVLGFRVDLQKSTDSVGSN
jgi:hypothetical protein